MPGQVLDKHIMQHCELKTRHDQATPLASKRVCCDWGVRADEAVGSFKTKRGVVYTPKPECLNVIPVQVDAKTHVKQSVLKSQHYQAAPLASTRGVRDWESAGWWSCGPSPAKQGLFIHQTLHSRCRACTCG